MATRITLSRPLTAVLLGVRFIHGVATVPHLYSKQRQYFQVRGARIEDLDPEPAAETTPEVEEPKKRSLFRKK